MKQRNLAESLTAQTTVGERLRWARRRCKPRMSRQALAAKVGISQKAIQLIEEGKTRHSRYLDLIARTLKVSLNWLAEGIGDPDQRTEDPRVAYLPILGGDGALRDDGREPFPRMLLAGRGRDCFLYRLLDRSMSPDLPANAWVLADPDTRPEPGRLALVVVSGHEPLVREWRDRGASIELWPRNEAHAVVSVAKRDVQVFAAVLGWWVSY